VKSCGALNVEFYTGIGTVLEAPALLPPDLDLGYLPGKRVLLVDDVADSGRTLALAVTMLRRRRRRRPLGVHLHKPGSWHPPTTRGARPTAGSTSLVGARHGHRGGCRGDVAGASA
jgi:hypoxanthine phosphoribosyltransferase